MIELLNNQLHKDFIALNVKSINFVNYIIFFIWASFLVNFLKEDGNEL